MAHVWRSKWTFILAAIGSAAWLGNLWRFPFQVYDNGGAIFLVVYFILLMIIWLWLLFGEVAYGQRAQAPAPLAFWKQWKWWSIVWRMGALLCLAIVTYYSSVIWWALNYLWYSIVGLFQWWLPWAWDASGFFYETVLQISEAPSEVWAYSIPVLLGIVATWILIYFFTRHSASSVWKVVWFSATLPFLFLILLMIRAITLPGAGEWFALLTQVDRSRIGDANVWLAAAWQIFFSLSIWFGMMLTYGALKKDKSELMGSTFIVLIWDTLTSIMSAVLVFGTLWFMANQQGIWVTEVSSGGPWLAFVTIPEALTQIPFWGVIFAILFFMTIFFLAIDSAMAMVESVVNPIHRMVKNITLPNLTLIVCLALWLIATFFARQNGLYLLDVVDHYINSIGIVTVAVFEVILFIIARKPLTEYMRSRSDSRAKNLFTNNYFLVVWVISALFLTYTLIQKFIWWILEYDTYSTGFLRYGVWTLLVLFVLAVLLAGLTKKKHIEE